MPERNVTHTGSSLPLRPNVMLAVIIGIIALIVVFTTVFVVNQTEQGVVLRFGKFDRIVGPGLHAKLPLGIEKRYNVPTQIVHTVAFGFRTERSGINTVYSPGEFPQESVMLTGDLNIIDVEWIIQYRIDDPRAWLFNVQNREKTIRDISQSVLNQLVGDRAILGVLGPERVNIEAQGQTIMNQIFSSYNFGIRVTTVKLQNIVPPKGDVQNAFEDVNKAVQDMNRFINEGKEQYNQEIPKAQGQAKQMIQEAQGYAAERVNRAQGDVARFASVRKEYEKSPQVTKERLYIEMVESVFGSAGGTDLIDKNLTNFLPLKSLSDAVRPGAGAPFAAPPSTSGPAAGGTSGGKQ
ncbi:MAG TPA: FtsH protease activity modulator HflK [Spirochaetia bacterium]|nr:FtsH protease activity modulator HflK [Spirochaetia bacterium]